jgi:hypothetical protein
MNAIPGYSLPATQMFMNSSLGHYIMPPLKKQTISSIEEIRCEFCLLGIQKYILGNHIKCHHMDMWASEPAPDFFCSEGLWIVSVSKDRQSVVDFSVAYDYLMEKE